MSPQPSVITRSPFDIFDNIVGNLFKGVEPYAPGNLLGELRGVDIICVSLA